MHSAHDVLGRQREQMPAWLHTADEFRPEDFFSSRVVYYPGSGTDGQAFELFCGTHSVHCVLHIDLNTSASDIQQALTPDHPHHLEGYSPCVQIVLAPAEAAELMSLNPEHCPDGQDPVIMSALWTVLERQQGFGDQHGPERIAFLHIQAEAVWVCRSVWSELDRSPFAVVIQDHGFGGNWTTFGGGRSPLYNLDCEQQSFPKWLLVADNTDPWPTYHQASDPTSPAGIGHHRRRLYRQNSDFHNAANLKQSAENLRESKMHSPIYDSFDLKSPFRSSIPLLAYWSNPKVRLGEFAKLVGLVLPDDVTLTFEYTVSPIMGKGKASHTDLMIVAPDSVIGVEAKYTENPYDDVASWLGSPPTQNKLLVLKGWLKLISDATGCHLTVAQVQGCTYQLIHRTASVCSVPAKNRVVVYHCFDATDSHKQYYTNQLQALANLISQPTKLQFFLVTTTLSKSAPYLEIQKQWDAKEGRDFSDDIRRLLEEREIAEFGDSVVSKFEYSAHFEIENAESSDIPRESNPSTARLCDQQRLSAAVERKDIKHIRTTSASPSGKDTEEQTMEHSTVRTNGDVEANPWMTLWEYSNQDRSKASRLLNFMCCNNFGEVQITRDHMKYLTAEFNANRGVRCSWSVTSRFVDMNAKLLQVNVRALDVLQDGHFVPGKTYKPAEDVRNNWVNSWAQV